MKKSWILIFCLLFLGSDTSAQKEQKQNIHKPHPTKFGVLIRRQISVSNRIRIWNYYFTSKIFGQYKKYDGFKPDKTWKMTFFDEFDSFNNHKWRKGQPWGKFHPDFLHQYYSDSSIYVKNGQLYLDGNYKPSVFKIKDSSIQIPYAIGLIITDTSFRQKFGYFEIRSKNPSGPATWPAFWLTGYYSWPPEIDIFEMYGKRKGKRIHHRQTNIHWGQNGNKNKGELINGQKLPPDTDSLFHIYACNWSPNSICFYTDGVLCRKIKLNKKMKHWFDQPMVLVVNNSIDHRYLKYIDRNSMPNHFVVDYIRVYKKNSRIN